MIRNLITIMKLTFLEASRRRIAQAAFILGIGFLILYAWGFHHISAEAVPDGETGPKAEIMRNQICYFLSMAGLYGVNFLTLAMGALLASDTLAGEITAGTIQTVASKPISRWQILIGKWLGFAALLLIYLLIMGGGIALIAFVDADYRIRNLPAGISLIYLSAVTLMSLSLALSSRLSGLATGGIVFGLYGFAHVGGWVEQIGSFLKNQTAVNVGVLSSFLMPGESLWRRACYEMSSTIVRALGFNGAGPFAVVSVPNKLMILYAVFYMTAILAISIRYFQKRDL